MVLADGPCVVRLATWRAELDDAGIDRNRGARIPTQLDDYTHTLHQGGGCITKA